MPRPRKPTRRPRHKRFRARRRPRPARKQSADTGEGALTLDSKPWTTVLVDGERKGRTPLVGLSLPVGRHKITLINTTYSIRESFPVEIKRNQAEKLVKDYSDRPEVQKDRPQPDEQTARQVTPRIIHIDAR